MHPGKGKGSASVYARVQITSRHLGKEPATVLACVTITEGRRDVGAQKAGTGQKGETEGTKAKLTVIHILLKMSYFLNHREILLRKRGN